MHTQEPRTETTLEAQDDAGSSSPVDPAQLTALRVTATTPLAAITGRYGPDRSAEAFYAADLGVAVQDHDRLWVMFGDSWAHWWSTSLDLAGYEDADDAIGFIDLRQFPDGTSVDRWIGEHPAPAGAFAWQAQPPTMQVALHGERKVATPMRQVRDSTPLSSGPGLAPLAGFSNERSDDSAALFGLFYRNTPIQCAQGVCDAGLECDAGLGLCVRENERSQDLGMPCVLGAPLAKGCDRCAPVPGQGLCVDTKISLFDRDVPRGRSSSVPVTHEVGNLVHGSDHLFATQPWITRRFYNATARSVRDFDPQRAHGAGNDYRPTDGSQPLRDGVFLWGRPSFGGIHRAGRDAHLYLAWVPMPSYAADGKFAWQPQYYAGLDADGRPRFVEREVDSVGLDLDAAKSGEQPQEVVDVTNQMTVSYLPSLQRWIMLYGGDLYGPFLELLYVEDAPLVDNTMRGPIYARYAEHPWGPWTAPEVFMEDGDRTVPDGLYGGGGIMRSSNCVAADCVLGENNFGKDEGWLYGASIIDPWTQVHADGVDLYWHVSTWNPYTVILMKSSLRTH
jgi:hypothetical protein